MMVRRGASAKKVTSFEPFTSFCCQPSVVLLLPRTAQHWARPYRLANVLEPIATQGPKVPRSQSPSAGVIKQQTERSSPRRTPWSWSYSMGKVYRKNKDRAQPPSPCDGQESSAPAASHRLDHLLHQIIIKRMWLRRRWYNYRFPFLRYLLAF